MAASNLDKFKKAKRKFETTVGVGGILAGGTTLPLTSVTGLDTSTAVTLVVGAGTATEEVITGVVSGSDLINCVRGKEGTTDSAHSAGETVNMFFTETHWDDAMDGILVSHDQDGTLKDGAVDAASVLASNVVTTAKIADDAVTAAKLDGVDKSLLSTDSNPYKFYVYRNAAQTPGVNGKIRWDTEVFDTNNNFDSTTNYRYTAPVTGFYHLIASAGWGSTGANVAIGTQILKNGTTVLSANRFVGMYAGSYSQECQCHWFGQLTAGDYVEVYEGAGSTYALVVGNTGESFFSGYLVSRT